MRELTRLEVKEVSGGILNLGTGAAGAAIGGAVTGANYAINASLAGNFSPSGLAWSIGSGAASGFLVGTGTTLVAAAATGTIKGASVLGVSMIGAGAALGATSQVDGPDPDSGGS